MLAERFFLLLESLIRSQAHLDGSPTVVSSSPHVPISLPGDYPLAEQRPHGQGDAATGQHPRV